MSEKVSEKKVIGRNAAITLGIICIILVAGLGGAMAYYTLAIGDRDNTIASKNKQIDSLNSNVTSLQNQNKQLQTWLDGNETLLDQTQANNTNLQNQLNSARATTLIDGITYSTKPTPYGRLIINYYTLLPEAESDPNMDFGMLWHTGICWLLTPGEPTPPNTQADNGSLPIVLSNPDPWGQVLIDGWLYGQIPTNLTKFTMPQSAKTLWTETLNEPIPTNAQVLH